jgi:battenin
MEDLIVRRDVESGQGKRDSKLLLEGKEAVDKLILRAKLAFFLLGLLNNCGYVIVLSAASDLSKKLHREEHMSLFAGCLVFFSIAVKIFNAKYMLKIHHKIRIGIAVGFFLVGVLVIIVALNQESFDLSLVGSSLLGIGVSFGDANIQGFMKGFPPETFSGYASGTGGAGVFGSTYYLILKVSKFDVSRIFIFLFPAYIIYFLCFTYVLGLKSDVDKANSMGVIEETNVHQKEAFVNLELSFATLPSILQKIYYYSFFFGLVYFLEYCIFNFLAETVAGKLTGDDFFVLYAFQIVQCCYQIGVFISRSSLQLFKCRRLEYLAFVQFSFFCLWFGFATVINIGEYLMFTLMLNVGLVAGLTYVNTIYMILSDEKISKSEKEVSLNLNSMASDSAILMSSLAGVLFKQFVVPKPVV